MGRNSRSGGFGGGGTLNVGGMATGIIMDEASEFQDEVDWWTDFFLTELMPVLVALALIELVPVVAAAVAVNPAVVEAVNLVNTIDDKTKGIREFAEREAKRAEGVIDSVAESRIIAALRQTHTVALKFSPWYRDLIARVYDRTSSVSLEVFGRSQFLNQALGLLQLAVYDFTRLSGQPHDLGEERYFDMAQDVTEDVASNARTYARVPGLFWADFNSRYLTPEARKSNAIEIEQESRFAGVASAVKAVSDSTTAVVDRFTEYREQLGSFVDRDKLKQLDKIRREFEWRVEQPLEKVAEFLTAEFPEVEERVSDNEKDIDAIGEEVDALSEITARPSTLPTGPRNRQRERISQWIDALGSTGEKPPEEIARGQNRISFLAREFRREGKD